MTGSMSFDNLSSVMKTSESFSDLNSELNPLVLGRGHSSWVSSVKASVPLSTTEEQSSATGTINKPFGLGKPISQILCFLLSFYCTHWAKHLKNNERKGPIFVGLSNME